MTGRPLPSATRPVGVLGGTFDPVHFGHLRAAVEAREMLGLDDLRLLPAGRPAHRGEPGAAPEHRLAMLERALERCPGLRADDREVRRPGVSFMVDTLAAIRAEIGSEPLLLLVGQDAANHLDTWHRWPRLFELAHLVVLRRPESHFQCQGDLRDEVMARRVSDPAMLRGSPAGRVLTLQVTQLDISSTHIRELIAQRRSARFLLPDTVIDYIESQGLYAGPAG